MKTYYIKSSGGNSGRKIFTIFIFFAMLTVFVLFVLNFSRSLFSRNSIQSSSLPSPTFSPPLSPTKEPVSSKQLEETVRNELVGTRGSYGIFIKNLNTGEQYDLEKNNKYDAASLYKLWVMATAYEQIKNGKLSDDDVLSQDVEVLNRKFNIASESAELTEGTVTLSVHEAFDKMITISDNYAALLLTEKVRLANVALFLTDNGFMQSSVGINGGAPTTTPYDIALFFEKLYKDQLINKQASNNMLSLLKKQKLNNKIPRYLPDSVAIAHKTGELDEYSHDAGIVYADRGDYIIVILSKSDNPDLAEDRLANISESVFHYFETR